MGGIGVVLPGSNLTMAFGGAGNVDGSSGCNACSAGYTVQGTSLAITPPSGTDMLCETPEGVGGAARGRRLLYRGDSLYLQNARAGQRKPQAWEPALLP